MPQNKLIYWGIIVLAAAIALYAGAVLTAAIKQYTPYVAGLGVLMILLGFVFEYRKAKAAAEPSSSPSIETSNPVVPAQPEPERHAPSER